MAYKIYHTILKYGSIIWVFAIVDAAVNALFAAPHYPITDTILALLVFFFVAAWLVDWWWKAEIKKKEAKKTVS